MGEEEFQQLVSIFKETWEAVDNVAGLKGHRVELALRAVFATGEDNAWLRVL